MLWPTRAAYRGPDAGPTKGTSEIIHSLGAELEGKSVKEREAAITNANEELKKNKKFIETKVSSYNADYVETYRIGTPKFYENPLEISFKNVEEIDKSITLIGKFLETKFKVNDEIRQFKYETECPSIERKFQGTRIKKIREALENRKTLLEKLDTAKKFKALRHSEKAVFRSREAKKGIETRSKILENPNYQELSSDYDAALQRFMVENPEFEAMWQNSEGKESAKRRRENKHLFFAILNEETNGFKTTFPLRKMVSGSSREAIKANKEAYPFVYHEWMKKKGQENTEVKIENKEAEVKDKDAKAAEAGSIADIQASIRIRAGINPTLERKTNFVIGLLDDIDTLETSPTVDVKDSAYWENIAEKLTNFNGKTEKVIDSKFRPRTEADILFIKDLKVVQSKIKIHIELVEAKIALEKLKEGQIEAGMEFTKSNLQKDHLWVLRTLMKKYMKAMAVMDKPFNDLGGTFEGTLHPAVRRMMIATVYREGVARINPHTGEYIDNTADEYKGLLMELKTSKLFEYSLKSRAISKEQREMLIVARQAWLSLYTEKFLIKGSIEKLEKRKDLMKELAGDITRRDQMRIATPSNPALPILERKIKRAIAELQRFTAIRPLSEADAVNLLTIEKNRLANWKHFQEMTSALLANPTREQIRKYLEDLKDPSYDADGSMAKKIKDFENYITGVDVTYNAFQLEEKTSEGAMEIAGMDWEGLPQAYEAYTHPMKHPENADMTVDNWDRLSETDEGMQRLVAMFEQILPDQLVLTGKKDFIEVFKTIRKPGAPDAELREKKAIAWANYGLIKNEIIAGQSVDAETVKGSLEAQARLEGMTWGDKITDYATGVLDMAIGPGQSLANRAAGIAIIIGAWKLAYKAYKGNDKMSKVMRLLILAGAAELAIKQITGEGLLEKGGLSGVAEAMEGTFESVLIDKGKRNTDFEKHDISKNEHAAALLEMQSVPFSDLMEWYKATKIDGQPKDKSDERARLKGIDIYNIVRGREWAERDKESRARLIIKETMENFFSYVGEKEDRPSETAGKDILTEIYVDPFSGTLTDEERERTTRHMPPFLLNQYRANPDALTWKEVIAMEIKKSDIDKVRESGALETGREALSKAAIAFTQWTEQTLLHPIGERATEAVEKIKTEYSPEVLTWLGKLGKAGAKNLVVLKDKIKFTYLNHEMELKNLGRQGISLIALGVELPFDVLYATTKFAIPFALTRIKQLKEILRSDKLDNLSEELSVDHIIPAGIYQDYKDALADPRKTVEFSDLLDRSKNPRSENFGYYQIPFARAFEKGGTPKFYESKIEDGLPNIGFLITTTDQEIAGIKGDSTISIDERIYEMKKKSYNDAFDYYIKKGCSVEMVQQYMTPVHAITENATKGEKGPQTVHIFWRMPLRDSVEYELKEMGRWADYDDANDHKFRPPFIVDPQAGLLENLKQAYGYDSPVMRKAGHVATIAVAQYLRGAFFAFKKAGDFVTWAATKSDKISEKDMEWVKELTTRDEDTLQKIDEWSGSAGNSLLALSEFYKNKGNAKIYKEQLDKARKGKHELYLAPNLGWNRVGKGRESDSYSTPPMIGGRR